MALKSVTLSMDGEVWMEKFLYTFGNIHIKILKLKATMVDFGHTAAWEPMKSNNVLNFSTINFF
jgi:hypothetical protein